jgi:manganese transport protein
MKKPFSVTLGIMTAIGGFVDLGQIVFTMQSGAMFGYKLAWAIIIGTLVMIPYMEMCGRIAVVADEPVFAVVRTCLGFPLGVVVLTASNLLNVITCAAELAGSAIILHLLTGWPERLLLIGVTFIFILILAFIRFKWIERTFGLFGLTMLVFAVSAVALHPKWSQLARGMVPAIPKADTRHLLLYAYFSVGLFSALLTEYQVHFYSSGAIEEHWTPKDLGTNFFVASVGSILGAVLTLALLVLGAMVFLPRGIFPDIVSTTVLAGAFPFGQNALLIALLGTLACVSGASIETALSSAYNICQFYKLPWGQDESFKSAPVYTMTWLGTFVIGLLLAMSGLNPLQLIDISIIFGMAAMPWTYYPILRIAADKRVMGDRVNSRLYTIIGAVFLVLITVAALAAIPLLIVTHGGQP